MNELTTQNNNNQQFSIWNNRDNAAAAFKMAEFLSNANLIPQAYRKNPGDCLIAIDLGNRLGVSPFVIMQNTQVVYGNITWKGAACKAMIDGCGKYRNSRYEMKGTPGSDDWGCRLVADNVQTRRTDVGPWVDIRMSKAEGWYQKSGSKWQTMPELMMKYRAASFFARTECPEVLMGFSTAEEQEDISAPASPAAPAATPPAPNPIPHEIGDLPRAIPQQQQPAPLADITANGPDAVALPPVQQSAQQPVPPATARAASQPAERPASQISLRDLAKK